MQICGVYIDGFGIFVDRQITGLTSGINVIYGANEFGKSTFLEFIRRILFGFPSKRTSINPYPALRGGVYGGKLICQLKGGESITIVRSEWSLGGSVVILRDNQEINDGKEIEDILDHITPAFYQNVYAISLDELQEFKSLDNDEVKNKIYGAGFGLGSVSLGDIKNEFKKIGESFYKPRGSSQKMIKLHNEIKVLEHETREIQAGLSNYDDLSKQRDGLLTEIVQLGDQISALEKIHRTLENKRDLFPSYLNLINAQNELSGLEEVPNFSEEALSGLEKLKSELSNLTTLVGERSEELKILEIKVQGLVFNQNLIDQESGVLSLQRKSGQFRSASTDIASVRIEKSVIDANVQEKIRKLGRGWTKEIIENSGLNYVQADRIRIYREKFDEAKRNVDARKTKLEFHREGKIKDTSKDLPVPSLYKYAIQVVVGLSLMGILGGLYFSQQLLTVFSVLFLLIGVFVAMKIRGAPKIPPVDLLETTLIESLQQAESIYGGITKEWREFLKSINFDETLSPDGAVEVAQKIGVVKSDIEKMKAFDNRIERMQQTIDEVAALFEQIAPCIDRSSIGDDLIANIEMLVQHLQEAKKIKDRKVNIGTQVQEVNTRIEVLEGKIESKKNEIKNYLSSFDVDDEESLRGKHSILLKRNELIDKIDESKKIIQTRVGSGQHYDDFIQLLSSVEPDEINSQLDSTIRELKELRNARDNKNQTIGELKNKIDQLSSSQDLLIKLGEMELRKQQLQDCSREWVKYQIALTMLNKAISKYENTRQPEVIKAASEVFSSITENKYSTIIKSVDGDEMFIKDKMENRKTILEMSRGTREQLYFAMRLGLIKEYETRAESMPVIMDDILVNFDEERGPKAIKVLNEFAKERQVIVLTCHKNTLDTYKKLGANEITIT